MSFRWVFPIVWITILGSFCGDLSAGISPADAPGARALEERLTALGPRVRRDEAQRLAECAYVSTAQLRRDYGVFTPALFHNFLIHVGIRKRGLCYECAEDLLAQFDALKLTTLELHWAEARAGRLGENNGLVVTAKGQPFREGVVLDCWRHAGHLFWAPVPDDHYPWVENKRYAEVARKKNAVARKPGAERPVPANQTISSVAAARQ